MNKMPTELRFNTHNLGKDNDKRNIFCDQHGKLHGNGTHCIGKTICQSGFKWDDDKKLCIPCSGDDCKIRTYTNRIDLGVGLTDKNIRKKEVDCGGGAHCPDGNTCCPMGSGWGCCTGLYASCCSDRKTCCPEMYPICLSGGQCAS